MDRDTELQLIDELLAIKAEKTFFLDETVARSPVEHYTSQDRFDQERAQIFRKLPMMVAHASEIANPGDFIRRDLAGLPLLITRDKAGNVNALLNACRHRGTRLVDDEAGCKHRFTCPYHAWTYANSGALLAAPHFDQGFTGLEKSDLGLTRLACQERFGFIWVSAEGGFDLDDFIGPLAEELDALHMDDLIVAHQDLPEHAANWKILVEGGIEAYHFKVAHRTTIGPHFEDNLSSYRMFGAHMRSILMRTSMAKLAPETRETWRLRDHAQVLYTLFPGASLLVQSDHISWIQSEPIGPGRTRLRLSTLAPKAEAEKAEHWQRNHQITRTTLDEDFVIGESMQSTLESGANTHMLFGRFEGALDAFNRTVDAHLTPTGPRAVAAE
ncbi:MAG: aromatic ring-hydroxylating oxygenase subunit alpha [Henriciella sp.]